MPRLRGRSHFGAAKARCSLRAGGCSGDEPRKTYGLLRGEDIILFRANTGFNAPREPPRWKVEDFLTGFTSILEFSIPVGFSFIPAAGDHGLWPWRNAPSCGRDVAPHGRRKGDHGLCPWGSINNRSYGEGTLEETEIPFSTKVNLEFR